MSRKTVDISTRSRASDAATFLGLDCDRSATLITKSPMRSRSVVDFRLESNWRARASFTRVIAAGNRSSIWRSIRSSSCSQSLMARNAMRDELVSRSRTLKAASRAMRHAFSARPARSSAPLARDSGVDLARRGPVSGGSPSIIRDVGTFRGMGNRDVIRSRFPSSLDLKCERMVTTLLGGESRSTWNRRNRCQGGQFREPC